MMMLQQLPMSTNMSPGTLSRKVVEVIAGAASGRQAAQPPAPPPPPMFEQPVQQAQQQHQQPSRAKATSAPPPPPPCFPPELEKVSSSSSSSSSGLGSKLRGPALRTIDPNVLSTAQLKPLAASNSQQYMRHQPKKALELNEILKETLNEKYKRAIPTEVADPTVEWTT